MKNKSLIKNSVLVLMLFGLFTLPYLASGFIEYDKPQSSVLGAQKTFTVVNKEDSTNSTDIDNLRERRIDIDLNLTKDRTQTFYDVLNGIQIKDDAMITVVLPVEYEDKGFRVAKQHENSRVNLIVTTPSKFDDTVLPVTLLVIER